MPEHVILTSCKQCKNEVYEVLKQQYPKLTMQRKLLADQIPGGVGACEPDGGAWFYDNKIGNNQC